MQILKYATLIWTVLFAGTAAAQYQNMPDQSVVTDSWTNPVPGVNYSQMPPERNGIRTWTPSTPLATWNSLTLNDMDHKDAYVTVDYFDGFGRPLQSVLNRGALDNPA